MSSVFKVACVQVNAGRQIAPGIEAACDLVRQACEAGADFVLSPENVVMMEPCSHRLREKAFPEDEHPALAAFCKVALETGVWILVGSLVVRLDDGALANRCLLLGSDGKVKARYDKIHMFDVDLDEGESYRESSIFRPGARAVLARSPWGVLGLSICYDLRFAYLYRTLAQKGADFLAAPAAFTRQTGQDHWHVLNRARAIETGSYVFAPGQCGSHAQGRETYGHSLIIDPWGRVLADGGKEPGFILAEVDLAEVAAARRKIPALTHSREIL